LSTTLTARSALPSTASRIPTTFSTALPAIATMTRPAKAWLMPSIFIAGSRASTNQSDTRAAAIPHRIVRRVAPAYLQGERETAINGL
jgi:hypothetical protein